MNTLQCNRKNRYPKNMFRNNIGLSEFSRHSRVPKLQQYLGKTVGKIEALPMYPFPNKIRHLFNDGNLSYIRWPYGN